MKCLAVNRVYRCVRDQLLNKNVVGAHIKMMIEKYGLKIRVSRSTVHRMIRSVCMQDKARRIWYTADYSWPGVMGYPT